MSPQPPPAMRLKTRWFKPGQPRSAVEQAGAMAFITFRIGHQMVKRMRGAQFDIDAGVPYFAFLREVLAFLAVVADRLAYVRLAADERAAFTTALVRQLAHTLAENETELLGAAVGQPYDERFIDLVNELASHYAEFGADPATTPEQGFQPDFAFLRYLGRRLEPSLPAKDRPWVLDQVMAVEAPDAVALLQRSMHELHDPTPRRARRSALTGD